MTYKTLEAARAWAASYRARNRERLRRYARDYYAKNKERTRLNYRASGARYRSKVRDTQQYKEQNRRGMALWYRANKLRHHANVSAQRRNTLIVPRQTPSWANKFFISEIYALAKLRSKYLGVRHEVDHIIPLRGESVCGLHVENNLRVVPRAINIAKGNKMQVVY